MSSKQELRILQNNLHKNRERTHGILNDPDIARYTTLMLQEQYWSPYTKCSPLHQSWTLFEPTLTSDRPPRAATYTNNKQLSASRISQVPVPSSDVVAIEITPPDSQKPTLLINIYNPCDESVLATVHTHLLQKFRAHNYGIIIMGGDFNCHHPMWNPRGYA